jgi:hypothetical protein
MRRTITYEIYYMRAEPRTFAGYTALYAVTANVLPPRPGSAEEPPEDGEVEIIGVKECVEPSKFNPTYHFRTLKMSDWSFHDGDYEELRRLFLDLL